MLARVPHLAALAVALAALPITGRAQPLIDPDVPTISYVNFPALEQTMSRTVSGQLRVPAGVSGKVPAVVIVHGSGGVDSRGRFYAEALNKAGFATLEIDMWAARGWLGGVTGRPRSVPQTLPDAYGALVFLSQLPHVDASRIGIMGFSWGGVVTMLSATAPYTDAYTGSLRFAAHVANYPVCWVYNHVPGYAFASFTGAPLLIQAGELDTYDLPDTCQRLVSGLQPPAQAFISVKRYRGATHAFDRLQPAITVTDPYSHLGRGGQVDFVPNPPAAFESRRTAVCFFERSLGVAPGDDADCDEGDGDRDDGR